MTLKMIASLNFHHREQIVDESLMRIQPRIFAHCTRRMMGHMHMVTSHEWVMSFGLSRPVTGMVKIQMS